MKNINDLHILYIKSGSKKRFWKIWIEQIKNSILTYLSKRSEIVRNKFNNDDINLFIMLSNKYKKYILLEYIFGFEDNISFKDVISAFKSSYKSCTTGDDCDTESSCVLTNNICVPDDHLDNFESTSKTTYPISSLVFKY